MGTPDTLTSGTGATFTQAFDAFGAPDPDNAELTRNGFTGHEHDRDLGLIDMKGRIYDPLAGQFLSADPVMQAPHWSQGMNRYAYVFNDPVNATDPSGFAAAGLDGYAVPAHLAGTTAALFASSTAGLGAAGGIGGLSGATSLALGVPGMFTSIPGYSGTVANAASVAPTAGVATQPGMADALGGNKPFATGVPVQEGVAPLTLEKAPGTSLFDPERGALACNGGGDVCIEILRRQRAEALKKAQIVAGMPVVGPGSLGAFSQRTIGTFVLQLRSGLIGDTFVHEIKVIANTSAKEATRAQLGSLAGTLTAETRAAGATSVEIRGVKVVNRGILRLKGLAKDLGFAVKEVGNDLITFVKGL